MLAALFCKKFLFLSPKCLFFLQNTAFFTKKSHMNIMRPIFLVKRSYSAGVCEPVAGNVGTFSASVD